VSPLPFADPLSIGEAPHHFESHPDHYMLLADYNAYVLCEDRVDVAFRDRQRWTRMAILNVAGAGRFSIDRLVREYAAAVWEAEPVSNAETREITA
jgi:glucan phosphorylase